MRSLALVLLLGLGLTGAFACAGTEPERTQYLLGPAAASTTGRVEAPTQVLLTHVSIAPYIDQAGIVVETETGQVNAARLHTWAEPLSAGLESFLRAEISSALGFPVSASELAGGPWDVTVGVHVDRLHATMNGRAVLSAAYRIATPAGGGATYRFHETIALPREGYPGVVDAETALARELARAIAAAIQALPQDSSDETPPS